MGQCSLRLELDVSLADEDVARFQSFLVRIMGDGVERIHRDARAGSGRAAGSDGPCLVVVCSDARALARLESDRPALTMVARGFATRRLGFSEGTSGLGDTLQRRENESGHASSDDMFSALRNSGQIFAHGEGLFSVAGDLALLVRGLEAWWCGIALALGAIEQRHPVLLSGTVLGQLGCEANAGAVGDGEGDVPGEIMRCGCEEAFGLATAVCHGCYPTLVGRTLTAPLLLTCGGGVVRQESNYSERGLERLRAFTVRDVVVAGSPKMVRRWCEAMWQAVFDALAGWGLRLAAETATDTFVSLDDAMRGVLAAGYVPKIELRADVGGREADGRWLAVGSVNLHCDRFARAFDVRAGPHQRRESLPYAWTACVGLGLERLAWAVICQFGWRRAYWPEAVHALVGSAASPGRAGGVSAAFDGVRAVLGSGDGREAAHGGVAA